MQKKELENTIRIKEMDIEIQEEQKRTELLEVSLLICFESDLWSSKVYFSILVMSFFMWSGA